MKNLYLVLAIIGTVVPYYFFSGFIADNGVDLYAFLEAAFANGAAGGLTADLLLSSFIFWLFMFVRRPEGPNPAVFIVLNLTIGLSCALPAYLYWQTRSQELAGAPAGVAAA